MPEGDTVWQAARRLHDALAGKVLTRSDFRVPRYATADLTGRAVLDVTPRGKHLLTRVEGGLTVHSHLRMDGSWKVFAPGQRWSGGPAHQIRVVLSTADRTAVGYRLPVLEILRTAEEQRVVGHLGPDLLGPDWDPRQALANLRADPARPLGEALLDQRNLAGVGNVYKSEICFLLGVTPWLPVGELPADRAAHLPVLSQRLLEANRDRPVRRTTGLRGQDLFVYGRAPRPCLRCGTSVRVADQGDGSRERPTYWCPTCQSGPAPRPGVPSAPGGGAEEVSLPARAGGMRRRARREGIAERAAGTAQPVSRASIWPAASRSPSSMPIIMSRSICSVVSKTARISRRVPPSCSVRVTRFAVVGMAASGTPSASANPSVNSRDLGASTVATRHQPRYLSPSGPVM